MKVCQLLFIILGMLGSRILLAENTLHGISLEDSAETIFSAQKVIKDPTQNASIKIQPIIKINNKQLYEDFYKPCSNAFKSSLPFTQPEFSQVSEQLTQNSIKESCSAYYSSKTNRFSEYYCQSAKNCSISKYPNYLKNYVYNSDELKLINDDVAEFALKENIGNMEKLEKLRKFSESKYGEKFVKSCSSPFNLNLETSYSRDRCNAAKIDKAYERLQVNCKNSLKSLTNKCIEEDYFTDNSYLNFLEKNPYKETKSSLQDFYVQRINESYKSSLADDGEFINFIVGTIKNGGTQQEKLEKLQFRLNELKENAKLDPIFNFDNDFFSADKEIQKKSNTFAMFKSLLGLKNADEAKLKNEVEKLRKNMASQFLNKNCSNTASTFELCNILTQGDGSFANMTVDSKKFDFFINAKEKDKNYLNNLEKIYPILDEFKNSTDRLLISDARRCENLKLRTPLVNGKVILGGFDVAAAVAREEDRNTSLAGIYFSDMGSGPTSVSSSKIYQVNSIDLSASMAKLPNASPGIESKAPENNPKQNSEAPAAPVKFADQIVKPVNSNTLGNMTIVENSLSAIQATGNLSESSPIQQLKGNTAIENSNFESSYTSQDQSKKISELNSKLSASQAELAQIKSAKERSEQSAKIEDLQKQLDNLKSQPQPSSADIENKKESKTNLESELQKAENIFTKDSGNMNKSISSSDNLASGNSSEAMANSNESLGSNHSNGSVGSSAYGQGPSSTSNSSGNSTSEMSKSGRTSISISEQNSLTAIKPIFVLTKSEGVTEENLSKALEDKISEVGGDVAKLSGSPVDVVINGELQHGIIEINNKGKPVFKKVDKKSAKSQVIGKIKSELIKSPADLRMRDQAMIEKSNARVEYSKLKGITDDVLKLNLSKKEDP